MLCHVYACVKKPDTYVYLRERDDSGASLPASMQQFLLPLRWVMELELSPGRKLARGDSAVVLANLQGQGFHLQFPPPDARLESRH